MTSPWLLSLLVSFACAGEISAPVVSGLPAVPTLFAAAAGWLEPLPQQTAAPLAAVEASLTRLAAAGFQVPTLPEGLTPEQKAQRLAPILEQLKVLHAEPASFASEKAQEQDAAVELAIPHARDEVLQRAYQLSAEAKSLVWSDEGFTRAQRDELYRVAKQLGEVVENYMGLVTDANEAEFIGYTELQARARFHDAQEALVKGVERGSSGGGAKASPVAAKNSPAARVELGTKNARKLLEDMRNTKSGWGPGDLERLYLGFGFTKEEGGGHTKYKHKLLPADVYATVARHRDLAPGYAQTAVKLIDELERIANPALPESVVGSDAVPPLPLRLEDQPTQKLPAVLPEATMALDSRKSPPKTPEKPKQSPQQGAVAQRQEPSPTALAPATERQPEKKPETPAPQAEAAKNLPVPHGWWQALRRRLGFRD